MLRTILLAFLACIPTAAQLTPGLIYSPAPGSVLGGTPGNPVDAIHWGPSLYYNGVNGSYYVEIGMSGCFSSEFSSGTSQQPVIFFFDAPPLPVTFTIYYYATPNHVPGVDPWDAVRCATFQGTYDGAWITNFIGSTQLSSNFPTFGVRTNYYPYTISAGFSPGTTEIQGPTLISGPVFSLAMPVPFASDQAYTWITTTQGGRTYYFRFQNPPGQVVTASDLQTIGSVPADDDYDGQQHFIPTDHNPIATDLVGKAGTHAEKASFEFSPEGAGYRYTYHADSRKLWIFGVGEPGKRGKPSSTQPPEGWSTAGYSFVASGTAARAIDSKFSFVSDWKPGLVPLTLRTAEEPEAGLTAHAQIKYAIGPAFAPELDRAGILALVKMWATDYGFKFLQPLVDDPTMSLNDLKPGDTPLEQQVVETLRAVLQ